MHSNPGLIIIRAYPLVKDSRILTHLQIKQVVLQMPVDLPQAPSRLGNFPPLPQSPSKLVNVFILDLEKDQPNPRDSSYPKDPDVVERTCRVLDRIESTMGGRRLH